MDMVIQSGINFDAFGLAMRFGRDESGMHIRDMMQISSILDSFVPISRPMYITNVEVPGRNVPGPWAAENAGAWHNLWDQAGQSEWLDQFYRIALSKSCFDGVIYSSFADVKESPLPESGLLTVELSSKEAYATLKKYHDRIFGR